MDKISFNKLSLYKRIEKGVYVDITRFYCGDWKARLSGAALKKQFSSNEQYLLGYCPYLNRRVGVFRGTYIISPVTEADLKEIADIKTLSKSDRIPEVLDMIFAKTINEKAGYFQVNTEEETLDFCYCKWKNHKRVQKVIRTKYMIFFEGG